MSSIDDRIEATSFCLEIDSGNEIITSLQSRLRFILDLGKETCYCLIVKEQTRKLNKRYSSISATNKDFPIERLRVVVLYPWAGKVLEQYVARLQEKGYSMSEIGQMHLSDTEYGCPIIGENEMSARIVPLLTLSGIASAEIPRTEKDGTSRLQNMMPDMKLLFSDAQYVAATFCGANAAMLHAMFGLPLTDTDENAYLDLLSKRYARTRYLRLRRFSPMVEEENPQIEADRRIDGTARGRYYIELHNRSDKPQTLLISAKYAVRASWKELSA